MRLALSVLILLGCPLSAEAPAKRPMTFMDVMEMRSVGSGSLSPDGRRVLYTPSPSAGMGAGSRSWPARPGKGPRRRRGLVARAFIRNCIQQI